MKIEKGKFYRTRGGEKVEVLTTERPTSYSIVVMGEDGSVTVLQQNGALYDGKANSYSDLIAEWTEPVEIPWSDYPTWCKWVVMDSNSEWFGYGEKPKNDSFEWFGHYGTKIHPDYYPRNFTGDWTESLFERPNN